MYSWQVGTKLGAALGKESPCCTPEGGSFLLTSSSEQDLSVPLWIWGSSFAEIGLMASLDSEPGGQGLDCVVLAVLLGAREVVTFNI